MPDDLRNETAVSRRGFLRSSAAAGTVLSLSAATYAGVLGSNERIGIGFLGAGARAQAHLDVISRLLAEGKKVATVAVCDVWDGQEGEYEQEFGGQKTRRRYSQGLFPSARKVGLNPKDCKRVCKDYRRVLELRYVDAVCIATPDHWHARMCVDAASAGKHIYCETPINRTAAEGKAVLEALTRCPVVLTAGVQSMADPCWRTAHALISAGRLGHISQGQTGCSRNDIRGQWRYYRITPEMNPGTIDWKMFLGVGMTTPTGEPLGKEVPFDRALFAQWRCYWPFSAGPFSEFMIHPLTHLLCAMGLRYPKKVVGTGGLYQEHDGREVPDVATLVADFEEGCQVQVACNLLSNYPIEEVIRGRLGTVKFIKGGMQIFRDDPARSSPFPDRLETPIEPSEVVNLPAPANTTYAMWEDFLTCIQRNDRQTLCPPDLAVAASTITAMAVESYRSGLHL